MEILAFVLLIAGFVVSVFAGIWFLVVAFREHILWGLGCLFIPFVSLIFLVLHWREAGKPFIISLLGTAIMVAGSFVAPETMTSG